MEVELAVLAVLVDQPAGRARQQIATEVTAKGISVEARKLGRILCGNAKSMTTQQLVRNEGKFWFITEAGRAHLKEHEAEIVLRRQRALVGGAVHRLSHRQRLAEELRRPWLRLGCDLCQTCSQPRRATAARERSRT